MLAIDNSCIVIFGASGDLTQRMLMPALYKLFTQQKLPTAFVILGVSRSTYSDQAFRDKLINNIPASAVINKQLLADFCQRIFYQSIDTANVNDYAILKDRISKLNDTFKLENNALFYMATPPSLYSVIAQHLAAHHLNNEQKGWKRLVVEKPFGYDLDSAITLDKALYQHFQEQQIYRIDHYLGKETVQNMLVLRFANSIFEPLWNGKYIDYIEVTGAEALGVEKRGGYYDGSGAMRDMLQNHLLQVIAMVAMEPPSVINADSMRDEVVKVLQCLKPLSEHDLKHNLVLGQYTESKVRGEDLSAYRAEAGVPDDSRTETYVGLKMFINNWRWNGVPFYIRTGKRMPTRVTEVVIHFKKTPHPVFSAHAPENKLIIRIQPDEGIVLGFGLKQPGSGFESQEVAMDFHYSDLKKTELLTAYERLLLDLIKGDATLFSRSDAVRACWNFVQPILDYKKRSFSLYGYASGTWGPVEAEHLLIKDGHKWRSPCKNLTDTDYCEL
ncbi:glucose-6-phosphate 1-dehydrogenase [Psychromonas marina]|uniref:Glucose-6-phosphate 1-dehydrogenase n=1 Tax=Psychromonas marina TaxID=88364 RepID=A0ABQ6DZW1_9GAMM|nr:glucose-6-phosphate dehydrogenase [Psychromonas marina]GLS90712.1 glucose-6-phosphate 1-dehydrogenase [Psychromonas marina]